MASGWMPRARSSVTECCVGFVFCSPDGTDERHERDVDVADVVAADVEPELPDRLEEREDLDVADRAADLGDDDIDLVGDETVDAPLDLVGDVGDDLHGLAEVVAAPLGRQHGGVDRTGRRVRISGQALVDVSLVVAEIEVGLAAVVGHEHLAVLERVHRAGIDVDVRVELLHRHPQPSGLQQATQRRRRDALPQRRSHPTRHEDMFRHGRPAYRAAASRSRRWSPNGTISAAALPRATRRRGLARSCCRASRTASATARPPVARRRGPQRSPSSRRERSSWSP